MTILLKGKDGSVAIMNLAPGADKEEAVRKFMASHPEGFYVDYFDFEGTIPSDREFRDAWTHVGGKIVLDRSKARNIHLSRIRHKRDEALEKLDKEHLRHLSDSAKIKEIEDKKQILRDIPANIKGLEWPDTLEK